MYLQKLLAPAVAFWALLQAGPGVAQPLCKPEIVVKDVHFSQAMNLRRLWTATVDVDASGCAASSGFFSLGFVRLSETAPDLEFREPFIWRPGQTTVRVEFWWDEAVDRVWIADVAGCPCRPK
jgi:hypothetical protein